jgi:hypothetical protein
MEEKNQFLLSKAREMPLNLPWGMKKFVKIALR